MSNFLRAAAPAAVGQVTVPFGAWLPDQMASNNPGGCEALNVIPGAGGYAPFKDLTLVSGLTLPDTCRGAIMVPTLNDDLKLYAATKTSLYVRVGSSFTKLYQTTFAKSAYHLWQFVPFGTWLVALHPEVNPRVVDADTMSDFELLDGRPPRAACGARVGDFLVLGNLDNEADDVPRQPRRVRWNGFNRIDLPWITDAQVESDYNDMPADGGDVMAIAGREFGTVFQQKMISRMTYVGGDIIFRFEVIEEERGAISVGSVVDIGSLVFFIAEDGFFVWNGVNTKPLGDDKVNQWFFQNLNYAARGLIVGAWDAVNQCIIWAFPTGSSTALTEQIIYSYRENSWTHAQKTVEYLVSSYALPASVDDLTGNLDTDYATSFDDPLYQGGRTQLGGFDATHTFGQFTGAPLAATLDTSESTGPNNTRVWITAARPQVDLATATASVQVAVRDQLQGGALTYGTAVTQEIDGNCPVLADGRYLRFRVNLPAGSTWTRAVGVDVWRKAGGAF